MRIVCAAAQSQFPEALLSTVKAHIVKSTVFLPCIQECKVLASLWILFTATEDTQFYAFSFKLPRFSDSHDSCRFVDFLFFFFFLIGISLSLLSTRVWVLISEMQTVM